MDQESNNSNVFQVSKMRVAKSSPRNVLAKQALVQGIARVSGVLGAHASKTAPSYASIALSAQRRMEAALAVRRIGPYSPQLAVMENAQLTAVWGPGTQSETALVPVEAVSRCTTGQFYKFVLDADKLALPWRKERLATPKIARIPRSWQSYE